VEQELFVQVLEWDYLEMYELILIHLLNFVVVQFHLLINHYLKFSLLARVIFSLLHWIRYEFQVVQQSVSY